MPVQLTNREMDLIDRETRGGKGSTGADVLRTLNEHNLLWGDIL